MFALPPVDAALDLSAIQSRAASAEESVENDDPQQAVLDRLDKLEEQHETLFDEYDALQAKHDELSDDYEKLRDRLKTVAFPGHDAVRMRVNGRVHADMWAFPGDSPGVNAFETDDPSVSPQDRIGFRRLRFGVRGEVWHTMIYRIELELAGGADSQFRDAYLGWVDLPLFQTVLLGNQKRPYGFDYLNSSRYNVFLERPFAIEAFNQDSRRWGLQSYGVSDDEAWNWRYGVFNQRLIQREGEYVSDHWQMELAGRLANTWWYDEASEGRGYGHWAVSGAVADPDGSGLPGRAANAARFRSRPEGRSTRRWLNTGRIAGADAYQLLGLENVWNFGQLQIVGEYQNLWLQRREATEVHLHGGYVYFAYFLTGGDYMPWNRERGVLARIKPVENFFLVDTCADGVRGGWGAWQLAYRWSYGDFTDENIAGGVGQSHTFGLNWYWTSWSRVQFNAIYGRIDEHEPVAGQTAGDYAILGARFMIDF